jgi:hypothetical protein
MTFGYYLFKSSGEGDIVIFFGEGGYPELYAR